MVEQDIWEWRPKGKRCRRNHPWIRYISMGMRECAHCGKREALWADFGIVKKVKPD